MADSQSMENRFLTKITEVIEKNLSNEQFGVSELAYEIGMSRSNLLRKVKKITNLSVSQFIRQVRLSNAMDMLSQKSVTVSEVSYKVGFGSVSYFVKCFHDHYGYPPGEVGSRDLDQGEPNNVSPTEHSHQLAAIMFTDIQGYTALMQQDEVKALEFRNRHREVFNATTKKFKGRILQYYGDGTLSTFSSAIDAVHCGIEMQLAFRKEKQIPVRIGIHSGDIIFTDDEIIGDGVNVASRVESLAVAGSVFISGKVYDEVKNQAEIRTTSLGVFELKNVDKPMEVFAITNEGLVVPEKDQISSMVVNSSPTNAKGIGAKKRRVGVSWIFIVLFAIMVGYLFHTTDIFKFAKQLFPSDQDINKKSIAVLPFINDSNDSTNVYIVNGLMESILNNLQKIEDLRVISRTSVEKYRNNPKTIAEIAKELNVNYFIEGSGQKIDDKILLSIQLIEGPTDKHLWAGQYNRDAKDIFSLQLEVAKNIADKIEVIITPEEEERINKIPTDDLVAYDYFLKGLDLFYKGNRESLVDAITYFEKAIEHDNEFARAYADIAISYYFLDLFQTEKKYSDQIGNYADKAFLLDSKLEQSLIAKALNYYDAKEFDIALPYLEKALEYNPNSAIVINILAEYYTNIRPNTEKYLENAVKGIQLDIASHDSVTASFIYLHVSNAFIQSGFVVEAEKYINKSLEYNPENIYSHYVKAYILFARDRDLEQAKKLLIETLKRDSTRLDVMQEVGKICYYMRDYDESYKYYAMYLAIKEALKLDIYKGEDAKIGVVMSKVGLERKSEKYFNEYKLYAENDNSIYKNLSLAMYYSYMNDTITALENLKLFSQQENYTYWTVLFLKIDPLIDNMKNIPEFKRLLDEIEIKFWNSHKQTKASLEEKDLV